MRAEEAYALDYRPRGSRNSLVRKARDALCRRATLGEPIAPGGGQILVVDGLTGRVLETVDVSPVDHGSTRARMDEDLRKMTADEFAAKYLPRPRGDHPAV